MGKRIYKPEGESATIDTKRAYEDLRTRVLKFTGWNMLQPHTNDDGDARNSAIKSWYLDPPTSPAHNKNGESIFNPFE